MVGFVHFGPGGGSTCPCWHTIMLRLLPSSMTVLWQFLPLRWSVRKTSTTLSGRGHHLLNISAHYCQLPMPRVNLCKATQVGPGQHTPWDPCVSNLPLLKKNSTLEQTQKKWCLLTNVEINQFDIILIQAVQKTWGKLYLLVSHFSMWSFKGF